MNGRTVERRPLQVVLAQNYSLEEVQKRCVAGEMPRQHLWGADLLVDRGMVVKVLGSPRSRLLTRLTRLTGSRLGNLARQARLIKEARTMRADVVVCAEMGFARGLALLRRWRVWRIPLVGVQHPYEPRGPLARYAAGGFDQVICLSVQMMGAFADSKRSDRVAVAPWGPDLDFAGYRPVSGEWVVSTGRTHRDLPMLARAARRAGCSLVVHDRLADGDAGQVRERVDVGYGGVLEDLASAAVIAIPLRRTDGCFGITELNDALALGKPVVMTRSAYVDLDLDALGCGIWVDEGDEDGWVRALELLVRDAELRSRMGAAARAVAESRWNYTLFGEALVRAVSSAAD